MALTKEQLISLGFKPGNKKTGFGKRYDTLVFPLTKTDYLYINKTASTIWMCFQNPGSKVCTNYQVINIGATGYNEMKSYIQRIKHNTLIKLYATINGLISETDQENTESES